MVNPYAGMTSETGTPLPLATRILTLYRARKAAAFSACAQTHQRLGRYYDAYRMYYTGRRGGRVELQVPFALSICQADVARKVQMSFSRPPIVEFEGLAPEDSGLAAKVTALVQAQLEDSDSFVKAADFFLSADIYGTAIARVGWKHISRFEKHRFVIDDPMAPGSTYETIKGGWVTRFDGPDWEVVDLLDFAGEPNKKRIKDMKYAFHKYPLDLDDLRALAAAAVFDKQAVARLELQSMPSEVEEDYRFRSSHYRNYAAYSGSEDKFRKPVMCVDMIGEVPDEFAPDGVKFRLITVANDQEVIRNRPFPFWHGELPFISFSPMPDIHSFYGIGKIEPIEKMQFLASRLASQKSAIMDQVAAPTWIYNRLMGIDSQNLITGPNRTIGVDGPVGDDIIRPLTPDLRGVQLTFTEIEQLWRWAQQGTGIIEGPGMGMDSAGSDRQSATEASIRQDGMLNRQAFEAYIAEHSFIVPLANFYRLHNKQFLKGPQELRMLGSAAQTNPDTGMPLPVELEVITTADLQRDYRARANGASQILGRGQQVANLMQGLQLAQTNPVAIQIINWHAMFRQVFRTLDIKNLNDLFVQAVPAVNALAAQGGTSPEGMLGGLTNGTLPPEVMQAIAGGGELAV